VIWDLTARQRMILRWVGYPVFYFFALFLFALWTFPFDRVKHRVVAEFNRSQADASGMRLEIDEMSWYWFSGVEAQGIRVITPAPAPEAGAKPKRPELYQVDDLHIRYSILSALVGSSEVSFGLEALDGSVDGYVADEDGEDDEGEVRTVSIEFSQLGISGMPLLAGAVGLPITGFLTGKVELKLPEKKLSKGDGSIELEITDLTVGDGKAKIRDTIALPKLNAGKLELVAAAKSGHLNIEKFKAKGPDLELESTGKMRLRDPFATSRADLGLKFMFTDRYKTKDDMTKGLFGEPGSTVPGLFDLDAKNKRAKQSDGFYSWRVTGAFTSLSFRPAPTVSKTRTTKSRRTTRRTRTTKTRKSTKGSSSTKKR